MQDFWSGWPSSDFPYVRRCKLFIYPFHFLRWPFMLVAIVFAACHGWAAWLIGCHVTSVKLNHICPCLKFISSSWPLGVRLLIYLHSIVLSAHPLRWGPKTPYYVPRHSIKFESDYATCCVFCHVGRLGMLFSVMLFPLFWHGPM
jgi:hypothetical protein